jgi:hypothetical protein
MQLYFTIPFTNYPAEACMSAITVTLPIDPAHKQKIDIDVSINGVKQKVHYCVEVMEWQECHEAEKIECLRERISEYQNEWELVNIGVAHDNTVQLMFKQREAA